VRLKAATSVRFDTIRERVRIWLHTFERVNLGSGASENKFPLIHPYSISHRNQWLGGLA